MSEHFYSETHIGRNKKRKINEDSVYSGNVADANSPISHVLIVADGMGGYSAGEIASQLACSVLENLFVKGNYSEFAKKYEIPSEKKDINFFKKVAEESLFYIHKKIRQKANNKQMGTTCTFALIFKSNNELKPVLIGHVGDSRAYKIQSSDLTQLTEDDSVVWEAFKSGRLSKEQIRTKKGSNVLTQALGGDNFEKAHVYTTRISKEDILFLCSDGLHGMVSEKKVFEAARAQKNLSSIGKILLQKALDGGGKDNISLALYSEGLERGIYKVAKKSNKMILAAILTSISIFIIGSILIYSLLLSPNSASEKEERNIENIANQSSELSIYIYPEEIIWTPGDNQLKILINNMNSTDSCEYFLRLELDNNPLEESPKINYCDNQPPYYKDKWIRYTNSKVLEKHLILPDQKDYLFVVFLYKSDSLIDKKVRSLTVKENIVTQPPLIVGATLVPDRTRIDFGFVKEGVGFNEKRVNITNTSRKEIIITDISNQKDINFIVKTDFNENESGKKLKPNGSIPILVQLNRDSKGFLEDEIKINHTGTNSPTSIKLNANLVSAAGDILHARLDRSILQLLLSEQIDYKIVHPDYLSRLEINREAYMHTIDLSQHEEPSYIIINVKDKYYWIDVKK